MWSARDCCRGGASAPRTPDPTTVTAKNVMSRCLEFMRCSFKREKLPTITAAQSIAWLRPKLRSILFTRFMFAFSVDDLRSTLEQIAMDTGAIDRTAGPGFLVRSADADTQTTYK